MFNPKKPCNDCPFKKQGGIRLRLRRAEEIAENMLAHDGKPFWCHKTVKNEEEAYGGNTMHCTGALIFAHKNDVATQSMRMALAMRLYDPNELMGDQDVVDQVFDNQDDMVDASCDGQ